MKEKIVTLLLTLTSLNSVCSDQPFSLNAAPQGPSLFDKLLQEEEETNLLTLLRDNYARNFINPDLSPRAQQPLITAGLQSLNEALKEIMENPHQHHVSLQRMFGKKETTANLIHLYHSLLKRERTRENELQTTLALAEAAAQITQEECIVAQKTKDIEAAREQRKDEIRKAVEKIRSEARGASTSRSVIGLSTSLSHLPKEGKNEKERLLTTLKYLANEADIRTAVDIIADNFCPVCGPHLQDGHTSYRKNGSKLSLKKISSLNDLDAFVKKDLNDSRREIIAQTIRVLGEMYFSDPQLRKDLETIFGHAWSHDKF
jgi:hypothetical protein